MLELGTSRLGRSAALCAALVLACSCSSDASPKDVLDNGAVDPTTSYGDASAPNIDARVNPPALVADAAAADSAQRDAAPTAPAFSFVPTIGPFGLSSSSESGRDNSMFLPLIASAGCEQLRLFAEWANIQPSEDRFDFTTADQRTQAAASLGIETAGVLASSTDWALAPGVKDRKTFPVRLDAWATYAGKVASRYASTIRYWEVWNEPNSTSFNAGEGTAFDYATLVRTAYAGVKAANPSAKVGLTAANYDVGYLRQVIQGLAEQGAAGSFDFIALHPYELVLRMLGPNGELQYLEIVPNLRRMLRQAAPDKAAVPIRLTEIGAALGGTSYGSGIDAALAASLLVKSYVLGIVQGVEQLQWFEVKDGGGSQNFGLLDDDLSKRPAYYAFSTLTRLLGRTPQYRGWLAMGAQAAGYGFVFGPDTALRLAAWMPRGQSGAIAFATPVEIFDIATGKSTALAANASYMLTDKPILASGIPQALGATAVSNAALPFPWASNSETPSLASLTLGAKSVEKGLLLDPRTKLMPVSFSDASAGTRIDAGSNNVMYFALSPSFASYDTRDVFVRIQVRTEKATPVGDSASVNLFYQTFGGAPRDPLQYPYVSASKEFFQVPVDAQWHTKVWHLTDAMFVHTFGYGLYLRLEGVQPLVVSKVEVSTVPFGN
jgi:polysaccharide biosynthesis protein PslG